MAIEQPLGTDPLNIPDHALSHRVFANDGVAPVQSVVVDYAGNVTFPNTIPGFISYGIDVDLGTYNFTTTGTINGTYLSLGNNSVSSNIALGFLALSVTTGGTNTAVGYVSERFNTTGGSNTAIGYASLRNNTTGSGNVAIGNYAGYYTGTTSNEFFVNNQSRTNYAGDQTGSLLYGVFDATPANQTLQVNGTLTANNLSGTNTGDVISSLAITYTGTPQSAIILPITGNSITVIPVAAVGGAANYTAVTGPTISHFQYTEQNTLIGNRLETLAFNDLVGVSGSFSPSLMPVLTSLSLPELVSVGSIFSFAQAAVLTTLSIPKLAYVGGGFNPSVMASLTTLSAPELISVGGIFNPGTMANLTTFDFPKLERIGGNVSMGTMAALTTLAFPALISIGTNFNPTTFANLTTLSLPNLSWVGGGFTPSFMGSLTTVSLPSLTYVGNGGLGLSWMAALTTVSVPNIIGYGATIALNSNLGNLSSVTIGTIGTLKYITGATINISGQKLPAAQVNAVLALLVSLDGTNGTTTWGTGKTLTINGGTNAAPTGQGITDKATLIARGATVTTT